MGLGCRPVLPFGVGGAAGGQPDALLAPDKVWENRPRRGFTAKYPQIGKSLSKNAFSLRPRPLQKVVDIPPVFGVFFACVPFSEAGWDTYPTSEKKSAHSRGSGFYCFSPFVRYTVLQVYFQLQTKKSVVPQRFSGFRFSTAEEAEQYHCYTSAAAV